MNWEEWIVANKKEIEHVAGYEEQFVRYILAKIPEIKPEDVIAQYHFRDSNGRNRYIDFMILNKSKGYKLPIELDGYWKVQTYQEFDDMLKRQNDLVKLYGVLLRYTNKKMELNPRGIIEEIRNTLHLQSTNQLSEKVTKEQTAKRFEEYQSQLATYKKQLAEQKRKEQEQAKKFKEEQAKRTEAERAIKIKQKESQKASDVLTKEDIAQLQATITELQHKVEIAEHKKPVDASGVNSRETSHPSAVFSPNQRKRFSGASTPKTNLTLSHMVAIGSVGLIVIAVGANAFFSRSNDAQNNSLFQTVTTSAPSHYENTKSNDPQSDKSSSKESMSEDYKEKQSINTSVKKEDEETRHQGAEPTEYESILSNSIPAAEAYRHIGSYRVICGNVAQVKEFSRGTYLNLGTAYPNQDATVVVWDSDMPNLGGLDQYKGRDLCVKGTVDSYKGTPQVKLSSTRQIM